MGQRFSGVARNNKSSARIEVADMEQDPNLLFVIIRETHFLEMAGGLEMVVYKRIKR